MKSVDLHKALFFTDIVNLTDESHAQVTCSALLKEHPSTKNGNYYINFQGLSASPFTHQVYCDMTSKNGVDVTVIGHDSESII